MKPIYEPSGRAKEYGELACNIYTECNHGCTYCFARKMAKRFGKPWTGDVQPRTGIVEATERQIDREQITGKLIHLCFTCDPYPAEIDTTATREVIKAIKAAGNNVQILTKGGIRAMRDFDLLGVGDWFGVSISGFPSTLDVEEPNAASYDDRLEVLEAATCTDARTWISCEPVLDCDEIYWLIENVAYADMFKIGKLNYEKSAVDWPAFGFKCVKLCNDYMRTYYIKDDLWKLMEVQREEM